MLFFMLKLDEFFELVLALEFLFLLLELVGVFGEEFLLEVFFEWVGFFGWGIGGFLLWV